MRSSPATGQERASGEADRRPLDPPVFDAVVTPTRSLSDDGVMFLFAAVFAAATALQFLFLLQGLWPTAIGIGFNAVFLIVAVVACRRDQGRWEHVVVQDGAVVVSQHARNGRLLRRGELSLFGLAIERHYDSDFGEQSLRIRHRNRSLLVASDLSPSERATFGDALVRAIQSAGHCPRVERRRGSALSQ